MTEAEFTTEQLREDSILRFFHFAHLPERLKAASEPFFRLALHLVKTAPRNPERTVALRKLLEAKDAAVRANLPSAETDALACALADGITAGEVAGISPATLQLLRRGPDDLQPSAVHRS